MKQRQLLIQPSRFLLHIIVPTTLSVILLFCLIYLYIIPSFENNFLASRKNTIAELTQLAWSVMDMYEKRAGRGELSQMEAQQFALAEIEGLRYGPSGEDYFWVCDMQPRMIMHPYSVEMVGADLSEYTDSLGQRIFVEFIKAASDQRQGFLYHSWHTKYQDQRTVQKLSHVRRFEPWGWIVGTGVFLDDVQKKTAEISARLSFVALGALLLFSLLLAYISRQSIAVERQRKLAEMALALSREKYKVLVESATEPMMMVLESSPVYCNLSLARLLGYSQEEIEKIELAKLLSGEGKAELLEKIDTLPLSGRAPGKTEAIVRRKDGTLIEVVLTFTLKSVGDERLLVVTVRDMRRRKKMETQLWESREQYRLLTSRLDIGVFRATTENKLRLLEANPVALKLLGLTEDDLMRATLVDCLELALGGEKLIANLFEKGVVKEKECSIINRAGGSRPVSLSLVLVTDAKGHALYCDGMLEDRSQQQKKVQVKEELIRELQTCSIPAFRDLKSFGVEVVRCRFDQSISTVIRQMIESKNRLCVIQDSEGNDLGIVSDEEIRQVVVRMEGGVHLTAGDAMQIRPLYVDESSLIIDALQTMEESSRSSVLIRNSSGEIVGAATKEELLLASVTPSASMVHRISSATTVDEIAEAQQMLSEMVKMLTQSGIHARSIMRILTRISDAVFNKVLAMALQEQGEPPVAFAFVSLGSEGRGEQTLATDQDNAIIFADTEGLERKRAEQYFHALAGNICTWLNRIGYRFCKGDIMAMNPRWCQPLGVWKDYFSNWIEKSEPQDLMEAGIFFDLRLRFGEKLYLDELRQHILGSLAYRPVFVHQMAENTLLYKVPLSLFGNISVETDGEHANTFNIKHVLAMIVGYARIMAMKYGLEQVNTLQRLEMLQQKGVLTSSASFELIEAYDYLMRLRLRHQVRNIDMGEEADNHIGPEELTSIEQEILKRVFTLVAGLRKKAAGDHQGDMFF